MSRNSGQLARRAVESSVGENNAQAVGCREQDLISQYYQFVESIVARLMRTMSLPAALQDDFVAAGALGLVEAASRFDSKRGHDFRAFAFLRIRGAIIDHIRASCELSGRAYRMFRALAAAQEIREGQFKTPSKPVGTQDHTGPSYEAIEVLSQSAVAFHLYGAVSGTEVTAKSTPELEVEQRQEAKKIRELVATLPAKERMIIEQHYFYDRSLVEIAHSYAGLSKSWVSRLHDKALKSLREKMRTAAQNQESNGRKRLQARSL